MFASRLGSARSRARVLAVVASVVTAVFVADAGIASAMPTLVKAPAASVGHSAIQDGAILDARNDALDGG